MLAIGVRVRPCSDLLIRSSAGRRTSSVPSSTRSRVVGAAIVWDRVPLGPFTVTRLSSIATSTPDGTAMGSLPIRDMSSLLLVSSLPDVGEDFPTHALLVCLAVGQQALARRDDRDTQSAENLRETRALGVDPETGLADPANARDGALPVAAVLEGDGERLAHLALGRLLHVVRRDVALLLEDLCNAGLQLAVRH